MKETFEYNFKIHDKVYHVTQESPQGIVLNIRYSVLYGVEYLVAFSFDNEVWCLEHELTTERNIV